MCERDRLVWWVSRSAALCPSSPPPSTSISIHCYKNNSMPTKRRACATLLPLRLPRQSRFVHCHSIHMLLSEGQPIIGITSTRQHICVIHSALHSFRLCRAPPTNRSDPQLHKNAKVTRRAITVSWIHSDAWHGSEPNTFDDYVKDSRHTRHTHTRIGRPSPPIKSGPTIKFKGRQILFPVGIFICQSGVWSMYGVLCETMTDICLRNKRYLFCAKKGWLRFASILRIQRLFYFPLYLFHFCSFFGKC